MTEFALLGPIQVFTDGASVHLPGMERALLATLLVRARQVVPVGTLIDALWDTEPPPSALNTLQGHVKQLRRRLGHDAGRVVTQGRGYLADIHPGELDLDLFTRLHDDGRAHSQKGNWEAASAELTKALGMWRGEPLADVSSQKLLQAEAMRLAELRVQALDLRIEADLQCGRHEEVTAELVQLVAAHPLRERSWAQLMLALYRGGRQGDALAAYQRARTALREELGVDPGPELAELHRRILESDPALSPRRPRIPAQPATHAQAFHITENLRPMQTPADIPDFTGRDAIAQQLCAVLGSVGAHAGKACGTMVAISGPTGVGKSVLAIHVAHKLTDHFPDGQLYHSFADIPEETRPGDVLGLFLRDLRVPPSAIPVTEAERSSMFRTLLASRRMLIFLDDARDAAQLRPLLPGAGSSAFIATSSSTLADLPNVSLFELGLLEHAEARDLFAAVAGLPPTTTPTVDADNVLASCAGLPLAIRIAARRLAARPGWTVGQLSVLLADERRRLRELSAGDLAIRNYFARSYQCLAPATARMFALLGRTGLRAFGLHEVAVLTGQSALELAPELEALVDAHLLTSPAPDSYRLHDLTYLYAAEISARSPQATFSGYGLR